MKKRYILFGYQIQNGEFCIVQQEGAAVEYIFDAYSNGDSHYHKRTVFPSTATSQ